MAGSRSTQESSVLRSALDFLATRKDQVECWRNNTTGVYDPARKAFRSPPKGFRPGVSDILGFLTCNGRFLAFEAKRPEIKAIHQRQGVLSEDQRSFLEDVNEAGGVGVVFDAVKTLEFVLDVLKDHPDARFDPLTVDAYYEIKEG
jgi:hypothetical protein